ncbi:MAG: pilus assembly protein TadG-related protein [Filomicrobium sp.]
MKNKKTYAQKFWKAQSGTVLLKFGLILPVLLSVFLSGMDYAWTLSHRSVIQEAADVAALAGAKELSLSDAKRENVQAVVQAMASRFIDANSESLVKKKASKPKVSAIITDNPLEVRVTVKQPVDALVGGAFGLQFPAIEVTSVARVVGQPNICVLALNPSENGAISLEHHARVTGKNCAVYSNSSHTLAIKSKNSANLTATFICSRGGRSGGPGNFNPMPMTDCPGFDDPLSGRVEPTASGCTEKNLVIDEGSRFLSPGTYCGGIHVTDGASVTLGTGTYIFSGGPFKVDDGGKVDGSSGVNLYFDSSSLSVLDIDYDSSLRLSARTTGGTAGLLIFTSRSQSQGVSHKLYSNDAPLLIGTIYIPNGELRIDASAPIAQDSAYTAIVANSMRLYGGPHLILNTDYDKTDVPVPAGIRGAGQPIKLVE